MARTREFFWLGSVAIILLSTLLVLAPATSVTRATRQAGNTNSNDESGSIDADIDFFAEQEAKQPFINFSELKNLDLVKLLEINFINKSVTHYQTKLHQVHSSLQTRVRDLISDIRGSKSQFSPELQQKMNESFFKLIEHLELSPYCLASLNHLRMEIADRRLWPLKFIDAMEFVPSGLFEGVLSSFGLWEECIHIASPMVKWNDVRGKYCLAKVNLPFMNPTFPEPSDLEYESKPNATVDISKLSSYAKKKALFEHLHVDFEMINNKLKLLQMINMLNGSHFRVGLCFPSTCSPFELERAINKFLEPFQNPIWIEIEEECSVLGEKLTLNNYQLVAILLLGSFALLVAVSTCYEYYLLHYRDNETAKCLYDSYLVTFSAISNTNALLENDKEKRLCSVDTLVLLFVVLEFVGRSYVLPVFYGMINIKRPMEGLPNEFFTAKKFFFIRGSSFAACTYVLSSGIVLAYNVCASKKTLQPSALSYLKYIVYRWFSFVRRLVGPILLLYLMPLVGEGPIWHYYEQIYTKPCMHNLWPTFLFYSNFAYSLDDVCLPPSVVLSTLFYLSVAAPLVLYTLNYKRIGYVVILVLIILSSILTLVPKLVFHLPVAPYEISTMTSVAQAKFSFVHYFAATDQLVVVFVCGLFVGYIIKCKPNINLGTQVTNIFLWIGMLMLPFISTSWNEGFKPVEGNFSQFSFTTWFMLSKLMWSFGFGWLLFACSTGRAGPLSDLLSQPLIQPLGKLAFGVYLNHITILSFRQLSKKDIGPLTHVEILTDDISDLVIAFAISYIFYILIERPFYHWIKIVLQMQQNDQQIKRFCTTNDLENGKNIKEEIDMKPLNSQARH